MHVLGSESHRQRNSVTECVNAVFAVVHHMYITSVI